MTNPRSLFLPKHPECETQCPSCPFRNGNESAFGDVLNKLRLANNQKPRKGFSKIHMAADAKAQIHAEVRFNGDFVCHHTVYAFPANMKRGDKAELRPSDERRQCPGATRFFRSFPSVVPTTKKEKP